MVKYPLFLLMFFIASVAIANNKKISTEEYIDIYKQLAINEMHRSGIPASITMAQGILESGSGNSRLAIEAKNHFGIKCHKEWTGPAIYVDDDAKNECFRKYELVEQSFIDHSDFLITRSRYAFLFDLDQEDYKGWAHGLKKAGYATNPEYGSLLIGLIERYNLTRLDSGDSQQNFVIDDKTDDQKAEVYAKKVFFTNRIKTVYLQPGETLVDIAKKHDIREKKIIKYNEIEDGRELKPGMKVFLQPKRNKGAIKYHKVARNETMYSISQQYGIKLEKLYDRNKMEEGTEPAIGEKLNLRGKRKTPVRVRDIQKDSKKNDQQTDKAKTATEKSVSNEALKKKPVIEAERAEKIEVAKKNDVKEVSDGELIFIESEEHKVKLDVNGNKSNENARQKQNETERPATQNFIYHSIKEGDTLYNISKKYKVTIQQIREWNKLEDNTIKIGQSIIVGIAN